MFKLIVQNNFDNFFVLWYNESSNFIFILSVNEISASLLTASERMIMVKKIASVLLACFLMTTLYTTVFAAEHQDDANAECTRVLINSSESTLYSSVAPRGAPCTGSHSVAIWSEEGHYYLDSPNSSACRIYVVDFRGLCNKCNYYVGKTERTQLQHNFPGGGAMCTNGCGHGYVR